MAAGAAAGASEALARPGLAGTAPAARKEAPASAPAVVDTLLAEEKAEAVEAERRER